MLSTACLLTASLLIQVPPPVPTPKPEERKAAVALDPELKRTLDALRATNGMRFEAVVNAHAPQPRAMRGSAAPAPMRAPDVGDEIRLVATVERDKPMQIEHDHLDAFRQGDRVAWKAKDSEEWQLFVFKHGASEHRPAARPRPASLRIAEDDRLLRVIAQLATPRELIEETESRITSCTKVTPREGEETGTVFECTLEPDVARRAFTSLLVGDSLRIDTLTAAYTLRIAVDHGQVKQLALEHHLPLRNGGPAIMKREAADPAEAGLGGAGDPETPVEMLRRYVIRESGNVTVEVPDEVKRLFEGPGTSADAPSATPPTGRRSH